MVVGLDNSIVKYNVIHVLLTILIWLYYIDYCKKMFSDRVLTVYTLLKLFQDSMYIVVGSIVEICKELCSLLGDEDNSAGFR